jgi:hypothetical protein
LFWDWISRNFVSASLLGIRRQIDKDNRAVSLARLLHDISENSGLITRDFFTSLYPREMQDLGNNDFNEIAGVSAANYPRSEAEKDKQLLYDLGSSFRDYIDRRLAHFDKADNVTIGTFADLYEGIDKIGELFRKYCLLLSGTSILLIPVPQYDWKSIFRVPWIR